MRFLILLLTFVVQRKFSLTLSRHHDVWAGQYLDFFEKKMPVVRHNSVVYLAIGIVLPAFLLAFILALVNDLLFGVMTLFINFVVLFMCLGCGYLKTLMDDYLNYWLKGEYQRALNTLESARIHISNADNLSQAEIHRAACSAFVYQTFQRYFIIIFWFMLAGPVGALVARLADVSAESDSSYRPARVRFLCQLLEWLPARLLAVTFSLVSNFPVMVKQTIVKLCDPLASAAEILEYSAVNALCSAKYSYYPDVKESKDTVRNEVQLTGLRELLNRSLLLWFAVLAVLALIAEFV